MLTQIRLIFSDFVTILVALYTICMLVVIESRFISALKLYQYFFSRCYRFIDSNIKGVIRIIILVIKCLIFQS